MRMRVYTCGWMWVEHRYVYAYMYVCVCLYRGWDILHRNHWFCIASIKRRSQIKGNQRIKIVLSHLSASPGERLSVSVFISNLLGGQGPRSENVRLCLYAEGKPEGQVKRRKESSTWRIRNKHRRYSWDHRYRDKLREQILKFWGEQRKENRDRLPMQIAWEVFNEGISLRVVTQTSSSPQTFIQLFVFALFFPSGTIPDYSSRLDLLRTRKHKVG